LLELLRRRLLGVHDGAVGRVHADLPARARLRRPDGLNDALAVEPVEEALEPHGVAPNAIIPSLPASGGAATAEAPSAPAGRGAAARGRASTTAARAEVRHDQPQQDQALDDPGPGHRLAGPDAPADGEEAEEGRSAEGKRDRQEGEAHGKAEEAEE